MMDGTSVYLEVDVTEALGVEGSPAEEEREDDGGCKGWIREAKGHLGRGKKVVLPDIM